MRHFRIVALGASLLALVLGACTTGGGGQSPAATAGEPSASLASTLKFGGPPECPDRPFCLIGLQETYGLEFEEFVPLDVGGPITVEALKNGEIDVALLFTSDPTIPAEDFVVLEDDKGLQRADNLVPVVSQEFIDAAPAAEDVVNEVTSKISQEELIALNEQVLAGDSPDVVAGGWLEGMGLAEGDAAIGEGVSLIVGSTNFYEQEILAEVYAQALEANGFEVERRFQLGAREVVFPALQAGELDLIVEYAATALEFVNEGAGEATADAAETVELLNGHIAEDGLVALEPAAATDQNAIVVTRATADEFTLSAISDLAQPAP